MNIFNLLATYGLEVKPSECKFHFAISNLQKDKDLFATRTGFKTFQEYQTKENFSRKFVLSFYKYGDGLWIFAGLWKVVDSQEIDLAHYHYETEFHPSSEGLERRLIVRWPDRFRNSYPNGETLADSLEIHAILSAPDELGKFPGYRKISVSLAGIRSLVKNPASSINWKTALASVAGVYVISDTRKEKLYVGSAYGLQNLWQRWMEYANTGHGGNKALRHEYKERGDAVFNDYIFTLLWHADSSATGEEVIAMEIFWKNALLTRGSRGYNKN